MAKGRFQVAGPLGSKAGRPCCTGVMWVPRTSVTRSMQTSAQAGITWGVPVARAERVTDSVGRGSKSGLAQSRRLPRELRKTKREGGGQDQPRELSVSAEGENADASGRVACTCAGRVSQEQGDLASSRDTRRTQEPEAPSGKNSCVRLTQQA